MVVLCLPFPVGAADMPPLGRPLTAKHILPAIKHETYDPEAMNRRLKEVESPGWEAPNPRKTKSWRKHVHRAHIKHMTPEGRRRYLAHIRKYRRINKKRARRKDPLLIITSFDFTRAKAPKPVAAKAASAPAKSTSASAKVRQAQRSTLSSPTGMSAYEYQLLNYRAELLAWWNGLTAGQQAVQKTSFDERLAQVDVMIATEQAIKTP